MAGGQHGGGDTEAGGPGEGLDRGVGTVELMDKGIEAALLGTQGVGGRGNGGSLQRAVHALVPTVLTGAGGASSLGTNAQADPPLGQVADAAYGQGGKRRPVVRTQGLRQAVLPKHPLKPRFHRLRGGTAQPPTLQHIAAVVVGEGQGVAPPPVPPGKNLP